MCLNFVNFKIECDTNIIIYNLQSTLGKFFSSYIVSILM